MGKDNNVPNSHLKKTYIWYMHCC